MTELLLINLKQHNYAVEITEVMAKKVEALSQHVSQKDDSEAVIRLMKSLCNRSHRKDGFSECFVKITLAP